ncbi:MAG: hypothetical protein ACLR9W_10230 [Enterobacter hormaechei]
MQCSVVTVRQRNRLPRIGSQIKQLIAEAPWIEVTEGGRDLEHLRALRKIKP